MTSRSSYELSVIEMALSLPAECSMRDECPKCGHAGKTFSLSRVGSEIKYCCFSMSCGFKGVISSKGSHTPVLEQKVLRHSKLFNGTLTALNEGEEDYLCDTFGIGIEWLTSVRWSEEDNRVYYPQYDTMGRVFGYIARHYPDLAGRPTKGAKAYWKQVIAGDPGLLFPNMEVMAQVVEHKRVVVVEDYPSMLRINSQLGIPTCCLGGTNIYKGHLDTMMELGVRELIILLDADAVVKAVKLKRGLSLAFDNVTVIPLTGADPKDMTASELNLIFEGIIL